MYLAISYLYQYLALGLPGISPSLLLFLNPTAYTL